MARKERRIKVRLVQFDLDYIVQLSGGMGKDQNGQPKQTELKGTKQELHVKSKAPADKIVFEAAGGPAPGLSTKAISEFSVFFPSADVHSSISAKNEMKVENGGVYLESKNNGGTQEVELELVPGLPQGKRFEYYVTAADKDGLLYTKDPDVYVDC